MSGKKYVYLFAAGKAEGQGSWRNLLGGKGAGLAEMTNLGIPVPPGFTITTEACVEYFNKAGQFPEGLWEEVLDALAQVEEAMGAKFGDPYNPLLVSVRSGARVSMPGMMDTVLNIGLNDDTVQGLIRKTNNPRFAYDAYRRFVAMFSSVVLGVPSKEFEGLLAKKKAEVGAQVDTDLQTEDLQDVVHLFKEFVRSTSPVPFPEQPMDQLRMGIEAVFKSWNVARAVEYRRLYNIPETWGTAVNVQAMVFGNMGSNSGTGVAFTRDPSTGERRFFGEFLINAQGEDVVAGIRTPEPIDQLAQEMPEVYRQLVEIYQRLERHYKDMLDLEFTVQEGKLFMLQTRVGKRTAVAALRIAVEMVEEGLIDEKTAVLRVEPDQLEQLLHPMVDPNSQVQVIARGLPASPGAAVGAVVFTAEEAVEAAGRGEKVILVRPETSPDDVGGMHAAQGILTARGGMTSHAAVVARGMGKCCVVGSKEILVNEEHGEFRVGTIRVKRGDIITLNGNTGEVILGAAKLITPELSGNFATFMKWVDQHRRLGVRANADTPMDAKVARSFGAEGIGLCRTEHMFFAEERLPFMQEMIVAEDRDARVRALDKLFPFQRADFYGIFKEMEGYAVTIRTLDPPLHEFLPKTREEAEELSTKIGVPADRIWDKVQELHETNPMLGHRGCRLGISYPEITEMQARAIMAAACEHAKEGRKVIPEIMIPLVGDVRELEHQRKIVDRVAQEVMAQYGVKVEYQVGTMIELPRAALLADEIARQAEFFSFGTNDLTQTVLGLSRDDAGKFLPFYIQQGIFKYDPFVVLDQPGVGQLVEIGVKKGRGARPSLKVGICGEHGGEPQSVGFFHRAGLDYVSCSPYRVPIARLAAAHVALGKALSETV
ncbi:MAG TPA: pyruvate, phosphate dikinase [Alphaproteobacteria bacterium]|nr:pyruvate, phosphate dikinase [Alphaproteobacteria bacterium]